MNQSAIQMDDCRENICRIISMLPDEKVSTVFNFVNFLYYDDEPPLSEYELAQIEQAKKNIEAGEFVLWEDLEKELAELP